jgi:hypothetical protein
MHRPVSYTSRHPFLQRRPTPVTISTPEFAYLYWPGDHGARSELYHLPSDPRQAHNVVADHRRLADELRRDYLGWIRERNPELAGWLPDPARSWKGMI